MRRITQFAFPVLAGKSAVQITDYACRTDPDRLSAVSAIRGGKRKGIKKLFALQSFPAPLTQRVAVVKEIGLMALRGANHRETPQRRRIAFRSEKFQIAESKFPLSPLTKRDRKSGFPAPDTRLQFPVQRPAAHAVHNFHDIPAVHRAEFRRSGGKTTR